MINSRYTIEYIEADSTKKKSSKLSTFFIVSSSTLALSALGLFAYITITGNSLPQTIKDPINLVQTFISENFAKLDKSVTNINKTDTKENEEKETKAVEANNEIIAQQKKIRALIAEKQKLSKKIKNLEQVTTEKTTNHQKQLDTNKALTTQLKEKNLQLQAEKEGFASLKERLEIQQIENETLSTLLNATINKYESKQLVIQETQKKEIASKPKEDATLTLEKKESKNDEADNTAATQSPSIEKITAEINDTITQTNEADTTTEEEKSTPTTKIDNTKSDRKIAGNTKKKENKSQIDAIIEAMKKAQSNN